MRNRRCIRTPFHWAALLVLLVAAPRPAAAQGTLMFDTKGVSDKPQSKLWYHDGTWWACLNNASKLTIYRLANATWTPKLDLQNAVTPLFKGGTSDALWDGTNLFVAVWDYTTSKIYKLAYDPVGQTYTLLAGFPVSLSMRPYSETIVLDKDSTGRLWATYEGEQRIYVAYTTTADHKTWSAPLDIGTSLVNADDISTVVAFGGNSIGVAWSDQQGQRLCFRKHRDSDPPATWQPLEVIRSGFGVIDDHLNMKADAEGRVYLVVKNFFDAVYVCRRDANGTWTVTTGASGLDCGTRPILQIDAASNKLYIFYTRWETCQSVGTHAIEERVAYLDNLLFSLPTVVIAKSGVPMNEVQGTKQILPSGSLAILCEGNLKAYWTGWGPISGIGGSDPGGGFPPPPPAPTGLAAQTVTESTSSKMLLWRFDENSSTTVGDASGNGRFASFAPDLYAPHWTPGLMGSGLFFDGSNYLTSDAAGVGFTNQSFTLEAWIKSDLTNAPSTGVIFARGDTAHANYTLSLTDQTLRFEWSYNDTTNVSIKASGTIRDGAWHHVAAVYDTAASQARIYLDGTQRAAKAILPPTYGDDDWKLTMGALVTGSIVDKTFAGNVDLACIYNTAKYSSNFTPPLLYPSTTTRYARIAWTPSTSTAGIAGYRLERRVNGGAWGALDGNQATINPWFADFSPPDGFLDYGVRAVDGLTQEGSLAIVSMTYEGSPPAIPGSPQSLASTFSTATVEGPAFWEMDEGAGSTAKDGTDLGHDAELGAPGAGDAAEPTWTPSPSGYALHFDGSNDYAQVADRNDLRCTGSFTVETWVRRAKLSAQQALVTKDAGAAKRNYGILILSNGTVEFSWSKTSGSLRRTSSTSAITDMEWHHVACVHDAAQAMNFIYLDGKASGSGSATGSVYAGSEPLLFGALHHVALFGTCAGFARGIHCVSPRADRSCQHQPGDSSQGIFRYRGRR